MARGGKRGRRFSGVKAVVTKRYMADDGKEFDTPEEASLHSAKDAYKSLYRMSEANIEAILNGTDPSRAKLVTKLAVKINTAKRADPNYVPRPRKAKEAAPAPAPNGSGEQPAAL